jgi:hypothetical protein
MDGPNGMVRVESALLFSTQPVKRPHPLRRACGIQSV